MIVKNYSKIALVVLAVASLTFAGCGGKKDDTAMTSNIVKGEMTQAEKDKAASLQAEKNAAAMAAAKPSTNSVYFAFDSAKIDGTSENILGLYAKWLNDNADVNITVEGNGDERGSREYNLALGEERAKSVRDVLISNGVAASRVDTVSFGEERPVCTSSGEACWAQNRHGDIVNR
jgi:peptidoglycan-associated lipoprotein